jgi:hypothetical protein
LNRFLVFIVVFLAGGVVTLEFLPSPTVFTPSPRLPDDRPAEAVPASWSRFAQLVQDQFKARLEADDGTADRFRLFLKNRSASEDLSSNALLVQVWVGADGKVERVAFPPLEDEQADADLHALLERRKIGPPPSDMPQPLHVKLALDVRNGA